MRFDGRGAATLLALACCGAARAAAGITPYSISASETVVADSNVYRAPDTDTVRSDLVSSTSLAVGIDQSFGRWRAVGNGSVQANRYRSIRELDNTGYGLQLRLQGETVQRLSGSLEYGASRTLTSFAVLTTAGSSTDARLRVPSLQTAQQLVLHGQLGLASQLAIDASATHRSTGYSARAYATRENSEDVGSLGLVWQPSAIFTAGAALRHGRGRYPNGVETGRDTFSPDSYGRDDFDLNATYAASGASTLAGRLSLTRQKYRQASQRDFSSVTGLFDATWRPTGKLTLQATLSRDTGNEATFYKFNGNERAGLSNYDQLATQAAATLAWDATAKLRPSLTVAWLQRKLVNDFTLFDAQLQGESGNDRLLTTSIAVRYAPSRSVAGECALRREQRHATTALSYSFSANVASCLVAFTLQ